MRIKNVLILMMLAMLVLACGGRVNTARMSFDERFAYAKKLYDNGKYFEAKTQFQILILNNPGSRFVDHVQYYLADCYFHQKEYITAAAEFEKLITLYPRSEFIDDAQYKICLSYYELSPKASLDQKYTYKAIDALQQLLEEFPQSDYVPDATQKLKELRNKLAKKEFKAGDQYRRFGYYKAALISYDDLLKNYFDTKWAEDAYYWKSYCHYKLGQHNEARMALQALTNNFPNTSYKDRIRELGALIDAAIKEGSAAATDNKKNQMER